MNCTTCEHSIIRSWTEVKEITCSIDGRSMIRDLQSLTECNKYLESGKDGKDTKTPKPKAR